MSHLKYVLFAVTAIAFGNAFADGNNFLLTFSTKGPDTYADGKTVVADGEWYALVWSPKASPIEGDAWARNYALQNGDEVVLAAPLAKGGHCPYTLFQVDSAKVKTTGYYYVCLLDTRVDGKPAGVGAEGELPMLNDATMNEITDRVKSASGARISNVDQVVDPRSWEWDWNQHPATINSILVVGENVQLNIVNMNPNNDYSLAGGSELADAMNGKVIETLDEAVNKAKNEQQDPREGATLAFEKKLGRFFRIIQVGEPQKAE